MSLLATVLTSTLVAVVVSSLFGLLGQYLERRARRNELIFKKALDMAIARTEMAIKAAECSGTSLTLYDNVVLAETYYRWLKHLFSYHELPQEAKKFRPEKTAEESIHKG